MKIIEDDESYTVAFNNNKEVILVDETIIKLHEIERNNDHIFNDILLKIYEPNN